MTERPRESDSAEDAATRPLPAAEGPVVARPGPVSLRPKEPEPEPPPARIRRFTVLRQVGQGGMGVVYSAYDDELDRKVAIKLMQPKHGDSLGRARLKREAQAMAKLAHPNIARVYEVDELEDGRVYIVMEYLQGQTLREWLREQARPWREVLAVMLQAGRGLAAAHAAGLVHRDFKPDNVMLAEDGFVRVLDFGLARAVGDASASGTGRALVPAATASSGSLSDQLTEAGTLIGTPPYMSPEQFATLPIGVESDQFSFCVALYEGLHGARPFKARSADELRTQIAALQTREPPAGAKFPPRLRKIVLRGLSAAPGDRWPSMQALLEELEREPSKRTRQWLAGLGIAAAAAGASYGLIPREDPAANLCKDAPAKFVGVWDDARRAAVRQALSAAPDAEEAARRVEARLDDYVQRWSAMYTEACEATHVRGEQSATLLDRRMKCLDLRRVELDALAQGLAGAAGLTAELAIQATTKLGRLERCADVEALMAAVPPPDDPAVAARVDDLRARLARARMAGNLGEYQATRQLADELLREAEATGYRPVHAEILVRHGDLLDYAGDPAGAEKAQLEAFFMAGAVGHHEAQVDAALSLLFVVGVELGRFEDALLWDRHAAMLIERTGSRPGPQVARHTAVGGVYQSFGKHEEASAHLEQAMALSEQEGGPDNLNIATIAHNLGAVQLARGEFARSEQTFRRSMALYEKLLGPGSSAIADSRNSIGMTALMQAEPLRAREEFLAALAIFERTLGPEHPRLSITLVNLGSVDMALRELESARGYLDRALAIVIKARGPDDLEVAEPLGGLAELAAIAREWDEAEAHATRALELRAQTEGPAQPEVVQPLCARGEAALARKHLDAAQADFARALEVVESTYGPKDISAATALSGLGRVALARGQAEQAAAHFARALEIRESTASLPHELGALRFAAAKAAITERAGADRARELARKSLEDFTQAGPRFSAERGEVEAWLATHR